MFTALDGQGKLTQKVLDVEHTVVGISGSYTPTPYPLFVFLSLLSHCTGVGLVSFFLVTILSQDPREGLDPEEKK